MGYTVKLYRFSKKKNSTKIPTNNTVQETFSCKLMDNSGMINPGFLFDFQALILQGHNPYDYNYAYVQEWSRYYFISDWSYNLGLWQATMTIDVLASHKTDIGTLNTYILRSASNYDRYLPDSLYPVKSGATFATKQQNLNPFATAYASGYFVVGLINGDTGGYGAVNYYVFTASNFRTFCNYLLSNTAYYNVTDITDDLLKVLYNPFQYVVSCTWLPVQPDMQSVAMSSVPIGWWSIPATCNRLSGYVRTGGTVTVEIPRNPEATTKPFMNGEPYTEYYLDFPPFGAFSISADNLINAQANLLDMAWDVDCITGMGRLQMGINSSQPFNIVHGQIGVPIQLAQMTPDVFGQLQQSLGSTGFPAVDNIITKLGNVGNALIAKMSPMQTTGSTGGFMAGYYPIKITGIFHGVAEENLSEFGAPCCKSLTINTLAGYVLCAHGDFSGTCTETETEMINGFLTSGFFYE